MIHRRLTGLRAVTSRRLKGMGIGKASDHLSVAVCVRLVVYLILRRLVATKAFHPNEWPFCKVTRNIFTRNIFSFF